MVKMAFTTCARIPLRKLLLSLALLVFVSTSVAAQTVMQCGGSYGYGYKRDDGRWHQIEDSMPEGSTALVYNAAYNQWDIMFVGATGMRSSVAGGCDVYMLGRYADVYNVLKVCLGNEATAVSFLFDARQRKLFTGTARVSDSEVFVPKMSIRIADCQVLFQPPLQ